MSKKIKILIISIASAVIVLGTILGVSAYAVNKFNNDGKILKNTEYYGLSLGNKTKEEAINIINESEELPINQPIILEYEDKSFTFLPKGAGISYDTEKIASNMYDKGRKGNFFIKLYNVAKGGGETLPLYNEDKALFENTIDALSRENGISFKTFDVKLGNNSAEIELFPESKVIDYDKLLLAVYEAMDIKEGERKITLPVKKAEAVTIDEIYNSIYAEPRNARADIVDGKTIVTPEQTGILIDRAELEAALNKGENKFNIKITKKYPEITTSHLSGDLFNDILGAQQSTYNASIVGRTKNVTLAASKINGIILNPGEVFSYNQSVGPRSYATGFADATIYTSTGMEDGVGGGICQVSSTLYNAALYADLEIVERKNHTYTVAYVKNGLDATVAYGAIDFRFKNNKSTPIKITSVANGGVLTIRILGKKDNNNKVELYTNTLETYNFPVEERINPNLKPGEKVVKQNGSTGYKINATKVVKDANGNVLRNEFLGTSVYKTIKKIVEVGPVSVPTGGEITDNPIPEGEVPAVGAEDEAADEPEINGEEIENPPTDEETSEVEKPSEEENIPQPEPEIPAEENNNLIENNEV